MNHNATGGIIIGGCAAFNISIRHLVKFSIGSRAYIKKKAKKGKLEYVILKKVNRIFSESPTCVGIQPEINYVDTLNRVWLVNELLLHSEAIALATSYLNNLLSEANALTDCSRPKLNKCNR